MLTNRHDLYGSTRLVISNVDPSHRKSICKRRRYNLTYSREKLQELFRSVCVLFCKYKHCNPGREIAPNTGANATKFFTLATKSWKLVAKLATRTFHHNADSVKKDFVCLWKWQPTFFELATTFKNLGAKWLSEKIINFTPCNLF